MLSICEVNNDEKLREIPVVLFGDTLIYYCSNIQGCPNYADAFTAHQKLYKKSDKRARILKKRQSMQLTEEVNNNPDASDVEVFRMFLAKLMSLQKQLDMSYHDERFLRDSLMTAVDIP